MNGGMKVIPLELEYVPDEFLNQAEINMSRGPAFILFYNNEVIGMGGICDFWKGVGEAWIVPLAPFNRLKELAKEIYIAVEESKNFIIDYYGYWRIQGTVRTDFAIGRKFAENLGLICEGILNKYFEDGQDAYIMAWVK
jgi:hypothetical protein